ncbi:MAG: hypothetical protein KAR85_04525 [Methanosarcinales archaeon]|nr:hypothetical protein [Methanosarcinales archaeon]
MSSNIKIRHIIEVQTPENLFCRGCYLPGNPSTDPVLSLWPYTLPERDFENARFRLAYFPFTEPSMEPEVCIEGMGWIEPSGTGCFAKRSSNHWLFGNQLCPNVFTFGTTCLRDCISKSVTLLNKIF